MTVICLSSFLCNSNQIFMNVLATMPINIVESTFMDTGNLVSGQAGKPKLMDAQRVTCRSSVESRGINGDTLTHILYSYRLWSRTGPDLAWIWLTDSHKTERLEALLLWKEREKETGNRERERKTERKRLCERERVRTKDVRALHRNHTPTHTSPKCSACSVSSHRQAQQWSWCVSQLCWWWVSQLQTGVDWLSHLWPRNAVRGRICLSV